MEVPVTTISERAELASLDVVVVVTAVGFCAGVACAVVAAACASLICLARWCHRGSQHGIGNFLIFASRRCFALSGSGDDHRAAVHNVVVQRRVLQQDRQRAAGVESADDPLGLLTLRKLTGDGDLDVRLRRELQQRRGKLLRRDVELSQLRKINRREARLDAGERYA